MKIILAIVVCLALICEATWAAPIQLPAQIGLCGDSIRGTVRVRTKCKRGENPIFLSDIIGTQSACRQVYGAYIAGAFGTAGVTLSCDSSEYISSWGFTPSSSQLIVLRSAEIRDSGSSVRIITQEDVGANVSAGSYTLMATGLCCPK